MKDDLIECVASKGFCLHEYLTDIGAKHVTKLGSNFYNFTPFLQLLEEIPRSVGGFIFTISIAYDWL